MVEIQKIAETVVDEDQPGVAIVRNAANQNSIAWTIRCSWYIPSTDYLAMM